MSMGQEARQRDIIEIIRSYDEWKVRAYCRVRFHILRQRFLEEIGQYLPGSGSVLEFGCGFGLFSLYYARCYPRLSLLGVDINRRRIGMARKAAERLQLGNVRYEQGDATAYRFAGFHDAVYLLDLVHHIPDASVRPFLTRIHAHLSEGSVLIIKDVDVRPAYKRHFTHILDRFVSFDGPVHYWPKDELIAELDSIGFSVCHHSMPDYLPYPHMLYICRPRKKS